MVTLKNLNDLAKKANLDPEQCVMLLREVCGNGDVELNFFSEAFVQKGAGVLNKDDEFVDVKQALSLQQLWIPDMFGN